MFQDLVQVLSNPLFWAIMVGYWLFSAAIGSMETPSTTAPGWHRFAFRFLHRLAGNLNRAAVQFKVPGASPDDVKADSGPAA